ncbi:hypothetical protein SAMN04487821_104174 [Enterococcus malodoratus]|nr:hypothetical protein SAMN04487821_104174 [Enterococcus malodoratus]
MSDKKICKYQNQNQTNRSKKILLSLLAILLALILVIVGVGAKMYHDVKSTANDTYESVDRKDESDKRKVNLSEQEPFSILLLGVDTGAFGRIEQGRSDTMMVATVNPSSNEALLVGYLCGDCWS